MKVAIIEIILWINLKSMKIWKVSCSSSTNICCVKIFTLNSWMPWSYHNDKLLTWEKKESKEKKKLQQKIGGLVPTTPKLLLHLWQNSLHFSQSLSASSQGIWPHPDPPPDLLNVRHKQDVCTRPQLPPTKASCCSATHPAHPNHHQLCAGKKFYCWRRLEFLDTQLPLVTSAHKIFATESCCCPLPLTQGRAPPTTSLPPSHGLQLF